MADTTREAVERFDVGTAHICGEQPRGKMGRDDQGSWVRYKDYRALLAERDAAQAEVARLTAALAEAETRGKEAGLREAVTICKRVRNEVAETQEEEAGALECAIAIMDAVNALPPRERDGQEG